MTQPAPTHEVRSLRRPRPEIKPPPGGPRDSDPPPAGHLRRLGLYGYDSAEPIVLAAIATESPLLLIGKAGTGKSLLLNALSGALGLEHRHYNASLIAFDDLVGFPFPDEKNESIRYLETPATVWGAESVLIDEIGRCRPEHQNRLFSLVHERRIQGVRLENLRHCWAAMNPCSADQGVEDVYEGSVPLDQALADRFAFVVPVPDWDDLDDADRERVADPAASETVGGPDPGLLAAVDEIRDRLPVVTEAFRSSTITYAVTVANALRQVRIRLSPRRVRRLARNLLALPAVNGGVPTGSTYLLGLKNSLPQTAWGVEVDESSLRAAHDLAWGSAFLEGSDRWLHDLLLETCPERRIKRLLRSAPDPDIASIGVKRLLASLDPIDQLLLAFPLYPAALEGYVVIGVEGLSALAEVAAPVLDVDAEVTWQEPKMKNNTKHPQLDVFHRVLAGRRGRRRERARQLFYYLAANKIHVADAAALEQKLHACISAVTKFVAKIHPPCHAR